jgi:hypothetical protein
MPPSWAIDWRHFFDIVPAAEGQQPVTAQLSYKFDTSLVGPLAALPATIAAGAPASLAARDLLRGNIFQLPTGQKLAEFLGQKVLPDEEILIGPAVLVDGEVSRPQSITDISKPAFAGRCPLWTYVLAEAFAGWRLDAAADPAAQMRLQGVGARIVCEVFAAALLADPGSYLRADPGFKPLAAVSDPTGSFGFPQLVRADHGVAIPPRVAPGISAVRPLGLIVPLKPAGVKGLFATLQAIEPAIEAALETIGTVHFARFLLLDSSTGTPTAAATMSPTVDLDGDGPFHLAVITEYDGEFDDYIAAFSRELRPYFNAILAASTDGDTIGDVVANLAAFTAYIAAHDLAQLAPNSGLPLYAASDLTVVQLRSAMPDANS